MTAPLSRRTFMTGLAGAALLGAAGCSPAQQQASSSASASGSGASGSVTVRLWDEQVQKAYDASFAAFSTQNPGITVKTVLVPWADYFTKLRTDVGGGNADDIFMMNGSYLQPYVTSNSLLEIGSDFDSLKSDWVPAAVEQYTRDGKLWGVPQLTDGGIAMYYNKTLLDDAGITPEQLTGLVWAPDGGSADTLLPILKKLTIDSAGRRGDESGFNGAKPTQWGYSAAQDLQGIYYNFIGSNGGQFQDDTGAFVFASDASVAAFQYIVDLINTHKVSPAASNTNDNGDFTRDQFLQGKIALFQSGVYNLKNVSDGAKFEWGIAPLPAGPAGAVSVVNSVIVSGNAKTRNPEATTAVLKWLGSGDGAKFIGSSGAAMPAVTSAQQAFTDYWSAKQVDPSQFAKQGSMPSISAPAGENYGAAYSAWKPIFNEIFLGRTPVAEGLQKAQDAANKAVSA
ncbi:ABC transporter substrate-binding protein [Propionicimonas sp.]|uniref:ABC transporter substrate-binding protein n=1 Tax=Propionicimonas sp. TaxID=1955623 RepID=UPI0039E6B1A9